MGNFRQKVMTMTRLVFVGVLLFFSGCDSFFVLNALVIDARTETPLSGARASLVLYKGVGEPNIIKTSQNDGRVRIIMNEPPDAWATLTIKKEGYKEWSTQFRGAPCNEFAIRLIPSDEVPVVPSSESKP